MKRCSKCGDEKPDTIEEFPEYTSHGTILRRTECLECRRVYARNWKRRKKMGFINRHRLTPVPVELVLENMKATDEERWIVCNLADYIAARMDGDKEPPCANDVLNLLLPIPEPWSLDPKLLKRHCELLSAASTMAKEA